MVSFGEFAESLRVYLVGLRRGWPEVFGEGFFFQQSEGFLPGRIDDADLFTELAIGATMEIEGMTRNALGFTDVRGEKHVQLKPEFFVWHGLNSLRINVADYNGAPDIQLTHGPGPTGGRGQWMLVLDKFPEDLPVDLVDALIEHGFSFWSDVRRVRAGRTAQAFRAAVRNVARTDAEADVVYWKNWNWNRPLSVDPLPDSICQYEAHGGVWTVVEGADEAPADPDDPLVAVCAEATRIAMSR